MMKSRFCRKIQSTILFSSLLMLSACASTKTADSVTTAPPVPEETTRTTIAKGKFIQPPEIQQSEIPTTGKSGSSTSQAAPDSTQSTANNHARISRKEASVNIRNAPSAKSRSVAVLKAGQAVDVLEHKDGWAKITWQKGTVVKQGWMNKAYLEEN
jgi:uncharacterized protein YgiM (DUF1202 family)